MSKMQAPPFDALLEMQLAPLDGRMLPLLLGIGEVVARVNARGSGDGEPAVREEEMRLNQYSRQWKVVEEMARLHHVCGDGSDEEGMLHPHSNTAAGGQGSGAA